MKKILGHNETILGCTINAFLTAVSGILAIVMSILSCIKLKKWWKIVGVISSCGLTSVISWLESRYFFKKDCKENNYIFKHYSYIDRIKWIIKGDDYLEECYEDPYED
jgi:hypothetical protein